MSNKEIDNCDTPETFPVIDAAAFATDGQVCTSRLKKSKKLPIPVEKRISKEVAIQVLKNGSHQNRLHVFCDYCGARSLRESIADGNRDVCMGCAKSLVEEMQQLSAIIANAPTEECK